MQSTSSAIATALPDRRGFLSTIASAGALSLPALPALATTVGPIESMFAEHLRLETELDTATIAALDAEERYEQPPQPSWHPFSDEGGSTYVRKPEGGYHCYVADDDKNIAHLRGIIAREHEPDNEDFGYRNAARAASARRTLVKIENWKAEVRRRKDAAGLTDAEAAAQRAADAASAQRSAMFAIEATTFRELAFLAAVLDIDWHPQRVASVVKRLFELAAISPYRPV